MQAEIIDLVEQLCEAAVIPELWPHAIENMCTFAGGRGGAFMAMTDGEIRFVATESYDPGFRAYVEDRNFDLNVRPRRALGLKHHGFLRDIDLCTLEELENDPIYERYTRPIGYGWTMGTVIPVPGGDLLGFELGVPPEHGPFGTEAVTRLDALRPYLARSAHLAARLGLDRARATTATLEAVGLPAAVVGSDRRVLAANGLFQKMSPFVATGAHDRLYIADAKADSLVRDELAKPVAGRAVGSIPVQTADGCPPLILHLTQVKRAAHDIFARGDWIIVATPVTAGNALEVDLLQGLFDLTATEARIVRSLMLGDTASDIAVAHNVSINTVRTQIQSVLAKTGVSRQADLIAMLSRPAVTPQR